MFYLYHRVPQDMQGNIIYPLHALKDKYHKVYNQEISKYEGRERWLETKIPLLNCLWNDTIHLSPVNPKDIKKALLESGAEVEKNNFLFYQIDPKDLDVKNTIVYLYPTSDTLKEVSIDDFEQYNPNNIEKYSIISISTKEYYKKMVAMGRKPLLFYGIPHILYKGTIDITNLSVIIV